MTNTNHNTNHNSNTNPTPSYAPLGTVSHDTMRACDLISTFISELAYFDKVTATKYDKEVASHLWYDSDLGGDDLTPYDSDSHPFWQSESASDLLSELFDALNTYAPPFAYFGAHEGDGCDYGFWIAWESLDDATYDGELLKVSDLSEVTTDIIESGQYSFYLVINDHGNCSLYDSQLNEVWSVV